MYYYYYYYYYTDIFLLGVFVWSVFVFMCGWYTGVDSGVLVLRGGV